MLSQIKILSHFWITVLYKLFSVFHIYYVAAFKIRQYVPLLFITQSDTIVNQLLVVICPFTLPFKFLLGINIEGFLKGILSHS